MRFGTCRVLALDTTVVSSANRDQGFSLSASPQHYVFAVASSPEHRRQPLLRAGSAAFASIGASSVGKVLSDKTPKCCQEKQQGGRRKLKVVERQEGPAERLQKTARRLPADLRRFLAGALAGAISKTATAPLEVVRMQMMTGTKGTFSDIISSTFQRGGIRAFFSGNEADILRTMPSKAIELGMYDVYKRLLTRHTPDGEAIPPGGFRNSVAGALAGLTSTIAMFPLETVRTRLAVSSTEYRGIVHCFQSITASGGVPSLYRGLKASLLGVMPYSAVRLALYDGLKWRYRKTTQHEPPPGVTMAFGAVAAVASTFASFPLEVVRRRMMAGKGDPAGTLATFQTIIGSEGVQALYKGIVVTWVKQAPQYAITCLFYDAAKAWLHASNGEESESEAEALEEAADKAL